MESILKSQTMIDFVYCQDNGTIAGSPSAQVLPDAVAVDLEDDEREIPNAMAATAPRIGEMMMNTCVLSS